MAAVLVIDADLNKRIATELKRRGRDAVALSELGLRHEKDPDLMRALSEYVGGQPWVLVTGDDNMPVVHADVIAEVGASQPRAGDTAWPRPLGPSSPTTATSGTSER